MNAKNRSWVSIFKFVLLVFVFSGCGDCVNDIIENQIPNNNRFRPDVDFGTPNDAARNDTGENRDTGRQQPKDGGFNFDFPQTDLGNPGFTVTAIIPNFGPVDGGNQVRIEGTGFQDGIEVLIGGKVMQVEQVGGFLVGRIPTGSAPGAVTVKALSPDGENRALVDAYTYVENLRVDSVTPSSVPSTGGTEIEIRGVGFTDPVGVSFSGTDALDVVRISDELLRVVTPPRPRGFADVRVTTTAESAESERAVEFFDPVDIDRVEPASGDIAGGETVTVFGSGFTSNATVKFGAQSATVLSVDQAAGSISVRTPPNAAGPVDVFVETNKSAGALEDGYLYRADDTPVLASVSPNVGPESGGNVVRLVGYGFDEAGAAIQFGANSATFQSTSSTYAEVVVPGGSVGDVDVVFLINGTEVNRLTGAYRYVADLALTGVTPTAGPSIGGTSVALTGSGFTGVERVTFDGVSTDFVVNSDTQITATTRSHPGGVVDVAVARDGLIATLDDAYTFETGLEIWGFSPQRGAVAGGTYVEVRGRGFFGELEVTLDDIAGTQVQRIDRNNLVVYTPAHAPGAAELEVTAGERSATGPYPFLYYDPAARFGGASGGSVDGSVNVTVYSFGGGPIANAFVMLSTRAETPYQGLTDANGQVTLSGPEVIGAQTTTATAAGFSSATIQTVDSENITLFLNELDPSPGQGGGNLPPEGRISGSVKSTAKLADPDDANLFDVAIVVGTQQTLSGAGNPSPGQNSVLLLPGNYDIRVRVGDMAVVAICGEFNQQTQEFRPRAMGVERFVFVGDKDRLEYDLECSIPLDQTHSYKLNNSQFTPSGPDTNVVRVYWDFGFEGILPSRSFGQSLGNIVQVEDQPAREGVLSDLRFTAIGGSYTGLSAPLAQSTLPNIEDTTNIIELPTLLDVPQPNTPSPGTQVENRTVSFFSGAPFTPDFHLIRLRNSSGITVWWFILPGHENTIRIPEFPDFSALPPDVQPAPLQQGQLVMTVTSVRIREGHVYEQISYQDIDSDLWETFSSNSWVLSLPPN